jgi:hypothetical protein
MSKNINIQNSFQEVNHQDNYNNICQNHWIIAKIKVQIKIIQDLSNHS